LVIETHLDNVPHHLALQLPNAHPLHLGKADAKAHTIGGGLGWRFRCVSSAVCDVPNDGQHGVDSRSDETDFGVVQSYDQATAVVSYDPVPRPVTVQRPLCFWRVVDVSIRRRGRWRCFRRCRLGTPLSAALMQPGTVEAVAGRPLAAGERRWRRRVAGSLAAPATSSAVAGTAAPAGTASPTRAAAGPGRRLCVAGTATPARAATSARTAAGPDRRLCVAGAARPAGSAVSTEGGRRAIGVLGYRPYEKLSQWDNHA